MKSGVSGKAVSCKFKDITEKDMDILFLEEIASSQEFVNIFLSKVSKMGYTVCEVEHSKSDVKYGESDITVIVEHNGVKHALLIEDKIDAIAMKEQSKRYVERGRLGIERNEYNSFDVFIVAPHKYLEDNEEAHKYPNRISYEEFVTYFKEKGDARSQFKLQQLMQAIYNQKVGYQVKEDKRVTDFWKKYIKYQIQNYPTLSMVSSDGPKGAKATWPQYRTFIKELPIYHKSEKGYVDLNFNGASDKAVLLEEMLIDQLGDLEEKGLFVKVTGKSVVLRLHVPKMDFSQPFEQYSQEIDFCFAAIVKMCELVKKIDKEQIQSIIL